MSDDDEDNNNNMSDDDEDNEMEYEYQNTNINNYNSTNYCIDTNYEQTELLPIYFTDSEEIDKILKLSEETHRMEQKYQKELNDAINKSMQHYNNINNNQCRDQNKRYQITNNWNNINTNQTNNYNQYDYNYINVEQLDPELDELLFKIAIEESQFSELNSQWSNNQIYGNYYGNDDNISVNIDNNMYLDSEFIDNDYYNEDNISYINNHVNNSKLNLCVSESKPKNKKNNTEKLNKTNIAKYSPKLINHNTNDIKSEIQYLIKKRKSFGKTIPKIERDNSYNNVYKVQIISN